MRAYQAYGNAGRVTGNTPREAASLYFERFPSSRKCNIDQGEQDGVFFTVTYGRASLGEWPASYKDVTKKTIGSLPE